MRTIIFGRYEAARIYAKDHGLLPNQWLHASSRERVMGLDPAHYETVIVGGALDEGATEALREWEFRRKRTGEKP